jgi:hypothetical protein
MVLNLMLDLSEISAFFCCCCDRRLVCFKAKDVIKTDSTNLFVTPKKRNPEFTNSPIHEFKVLQNVF